MKIQIAFKNNMNPCKYYSSFPNKRAGPNRKFDKNQISVQGGNLLKILIIRDFIYSLNVKKAK